MSHTTPVRIVGHLPTDSLRSLHGRTDSGTPYEEAMLKLSHDGELYLEVEQRVGGNSVAAEEWYGRTLTWSLLREPSELDLAALRAAVEPGGELHDLLAAVANGHDVDWDDNNHRGVLSDDAKRANAKLSLHFDETSYATDTETWDAGEWLEPGEIDGLSADTTDGELAALVEQVEKYAASERIRLVGTLVALRQRRESLQDERDAAAGD